MKAKKRLLTGIRASGSIHLGNYLGAIRTAIQNQDSYESFLFIADLHGLTTSPKKEFLTDAVRSIGAAWLASGLNPQSTVFWKQSDVREHLELAYILSCVTGMGLLERSHSYKDAIAKGALPRVGLFYYPVLMSADILLYQSDLVPVGKDQAQHLEMARDIATYFNEAYGNFFKLPEALIENSLSLIPGTDGRKMSKSYGNGIDIFAEESILKKQIMSIQTDSKTLHEPKVAEECLVFNIFKLIADPQSTNDMKSKLEKGGYGYGDCKKALLAYVLEHYGTMRQEYSKWYSDPGALNQVLTEGAEKARSKASKIMEEVRNMIGL